MANSHVAPEFLHHRIVKHMRNQTHSLVHGELLRVFTFGCNDSSTFLTPEILCLVLYSIACYEDMTHMVSKTQSTAMNLKAETVAKLKF